ncbi:MAG: discoidin domain-containing protein [Gammaproteobacteria bacterium]|nr:discoidin domain-containing protein [Gammaproteobacteria bacterium]MBU2057103.1 discoidin domain-containing protein [Gammaproteobacteria bacterium]MBU2175162.1 discoidin domain-containing protein [Gammaproteobacteria bacterium]MBU2245193.1 discoidin domain-containing protein [Gammaproteobacteria bacterium]MBU2346511.1 discoidin domain-containing protein [Gammaproteobacteria bacterium]
MIPVLLLSVAACGGGDSSTVPDDAGSGTPPVITPPVATPPPVITPPPVETPPVVPPPLDDLPEPELEAAPDATTAALPKADAPSLPAPPAELRVAAHYDKTATSSPVPVTAASSSGDENATNTAAKAIDGDLTTRWESAWGEDVADADADKAWLQFDFGAKTAIGAMKLYWENAHAKEYAIYVSDDAQHWYQLRYMVGSKGATEEFLNLDVHVRYLRLQGISRQTQYGYSLFEVEFKTPGTDNSMPVLDTSALAYPLSGSGRTPLPAPAEPIETVSFTLADGTLVTRFGMVGRSRHARERGEEWNEIGFGVNDTVDAAGNPLDKGPGAHLNFIANYFKNRTWGVEFIDNSNVAGVTEPKIIVNQYFQQAQKGGGHAFVRRFDEPGVTGFGWMSPGDLLDDSTYHDEGAACPVVTKPANGVLLRPDTGYNGVIGANDGCSVVFDRYPGHRALSANADGVLVPNGSSVNSRVLKKGDVIEFTSSFFSTRAAMDAIGDSGAFRYYTNELTYVMGQGLRPWYGVQPRLMNEPLPEPTLQGGLGSVSYDYADNPTFMFQQPHNTIGMQNMQRFMEGRRWLHTNLWTGVHNEEGNDRNDAGRQLQGPRFNQSSCFNCHVNNGRSVAPTVRNQRLDTMAVRVGATGTDANGHYLPHPMYGQALQMNGRSVSTGEMQNWGNGAWVSGFTSSSVTLANGTVVELRKPTIAFEGPEPDVYSVRQAQPLIGMGLLEAISDETILSRVRSTPDADGVLGTANYAFDPETGEVRLGRYGWKAGKVSLRHQVTNAALLDMAVTSSVYPKLDCLAGPKNCDPATAEPGLPEQAVTLITQYLHLLAVPAQRSVVSGFPKSVSPLAYLDIDPAKIAAGEQVFKEIRCVACHTSEMKTSARSEFDEVRLQNIKPYTDLLLHDMGEGLADNFSEGLATGSMWRTPALWGLGYTQFVAGGTPAGYLHDGRARTLTEAILWHGGEAEVIKNRFVNLATAEREALLAFLKSL